LGFLCLATASLALLPGGSALAAQEASPLPRITFTKTLKGSQPEYLKVRIDSSGAGMYDSHKLEDPPAPRPLQISAGTAAQIFSLAHSLNDFRSVTLESRRKVANMGMKTLAYETSGQVNKVQFNYTENATAHQLEDVFEKISNMEERVSQLEYGMKYDPLSLPQDLRQILQGMDDHIFLEMELMVPTLEKISSNPRYLHLAQSRAQEIMQRIQENK